MDLGPTHDRLVFNKPFFVIAQTMLQYRRHEVRPIYTSFKPTIGLLGTEIEVLHHLLS